MYCFDLNIVRNALGIDTDSHMIATIQYIYSYFSFQQRGMLQFDNLMFLFREYIEFYWFFWYSYN